MVRLGNTKIYSSKVHELRRGASNGEIWLDQDIPLCGDIKLEFFHNPRFGSKVGICKATLAMASLQEPKSWLLS